MCRKAGKRADEVLASFYLLLILVLFLPPSCHGYNQGVGGGHCSGRGGHRHRGRGEEGGG